ncbi:putative DNA-directed RNA polymerase II subunit, partial [Corchorus capsularis]
MARQKKASEISFSKKSDELSLSSTDFKKLKIHLNQLVKKADGKPAAMVYRLYGAGYDCDYDWEKENLIGGNPWLKHQKDRPVDYLKNLALMVYITAGSAAYPILEFLEEWGTENFEESVEEGGCHDLIAKGFIEYILTQTTMISMTMSLMLFFCSCSPMSIIAITVEEEDIVMLKDYSPASDTGAPPPKEPVRLPFCSTRAYKSSLLICTLQRVILKSTL